MLSVTRSCFIILILLFSQVEIFALNLEFSKENFLAGTTLAVLIKKQDLKKAEGNFMGKTVSFFSKEDESYYCLEGINVYTREGTYSFLIDAEYESGEQEIVGRPIVIKNRVDFVPEEIRISKEKMSKITDKNLVEENKIVSKALSPITEKKIWWKDFIMPATGIISSPYDGYRSINQGGRKSFHQGLDISCPEGSPVKSSNCGEVVFTGELISRGNAVIINHGQGVYTVYYHLSKIEVKEKDFLKKGDLVGMVGSTGMSSGPHLHWGLYVHEIPVEPQEWVDGNIDEFLFGKE